MIIAEIGSNHLGKIELANKYLKDLINSPVDGISFQVREKEFYQSSRYKNFKLDKSNYLNFSTITKRNKKKFGIALADPSLIDFFESLDTDFYKVIRNDIKNDELVDKLIKTNKKIFISTGMSSEEDIMRFIKKYGRPKNVILNHTSLSNLIDDCNLKAIESMKKHGFNVSYGNHCENLNVMYMSLIFKPSDIMFYVKACKKLEYPDNKHAVILKEVNEIVNNLKLLSRADGKGIKNNMENKIE